MMCDHCGDELDLIGCWMVDHDHVCRQCYEDEYCPAPENAAMGITLGVVSGFVVWDELFAVFFWLVAP